MSFAKSDAKISGSLPAPPSDLVHYKPRRLSNLQKWWPKRSHSAGPEDHAKVLLHSRLKSLPDTYGSLSDAYIVADYFDLYQSIYLYSKTFYTTNTILKKPSQAAVELATAGMDVS